MEAAASRKESTREERTATESVISQAASLAAINTAATMTEAIVACFFRRVWVAASARGAAGGAADCSAGGSVMSRAR